MCLDGGAETDKIVAALEHGYEASTGVLFGDVEQQSCEVLKVGIC